MESCCRLDHLVKNLIHQTREFVFACGHRDIELIRKKDILPDGEFMAYDGLRRST